ncbi:unnamed protein product [Acanthoscelides obtectus]|uniref:DUF4371 domain-containing protein n=1 Tax=Acanthoscelides obtectus TaxID=200917 RepID=A0A9P0L7J0_ACAOB|nr:unnamed protein product [Acanthoscelides obtectus]CAK1688446.1 hypothetical protein AOBTE_LOCUS36721 [Acanthoscelides obtectus]
MMMESDTADKSDQITYESTLKCGKSELEKHLATEKHKKNHIKKRGVMSLDAFVEKKSGHSQKVSEAEIKLSSFFAHHNAFQVVDHLIPILKDSFPASNILKDVKLGRTKTTSVINNVIAKKENEDLAVVLQQNFFSVLIDESTDISANKLLCVNVKFIHNSG